MKTNPVTRRKLGSAISNIELCEPRLLFSTYVVNTTSDAVNPGSGLLTLRQAITDANNNSGPDTIQFSSTVFAPGSAHSISLIQGTLIFTGSSSGTTTVVGPGSSVLTVDANGFRAFQVDSTASAAISGLTETNGRSLSAVGALASGAGIFNQGMLALTNTTITGNTATGGSGAYETFSDGGAAEGAGIFSSGTLTLTNSNVSGNTAQGGSSYGGTGGAAAGAGIFATGSLTVVNSTISSNSATAGGVSHNGYATGGTASGGGVNASGIVTITGSTVSNNTATAGSGLQTDAAEDSGAPAFGGGVYLSGSASSIAGSTFTNNQATSGSSGGGGGSAGNALGGAIFSSGTLTINSTLVSANTILGGAGPFDDSGPGGSVYGGGICADAGLKILNSSIINNTATGGRGQAESFQNKASAYGGGIFAQAGLSISNSTLSGNLAQGDPGTIFSDTYAGMGGQALGGGLDAAGGGTITSSTISGNSAKGGLGDAPYHGGTSAVGGAAQGGGAYATGNLTITNSTVANNSVLGGDGGIGSHEGGNAGAGGAANGGGIFASSGQLSLYDSTVSGNTASGGTGGTVESSGYSDGVDGTAAGAGIGFGTTGAVLANSIIDANTSGGSTEDDIAGSAAASSNHNLVGTGGGSAISNGVNGNIVGVINPQLAPLANYGGPTQTMLQLYNSPVINAGSNASVPTGVTTDQRGEARIAGGTADIGAVELQLGSVGGTIFNDLNGDGIRETGEPGLPGVTVYADLTSAGVYETGDPKTTTDSNGNYTLAGVPEGAQVIRQLIPTGYRQSYPGLGAGEHVNVTTAAVTGALFADSTRLYISGTVTFNGVGQSGVLVYADLNNDGLFESNENNKTTASDGSFAFVSLTPGTYTFRVVAPAGETSPGNAGVTVILTNGGMDQSVNFILSTAATTQPLTGAVIGTSGSYNNQGNTATKAFDGSLSTFFDAPAASGSWAGLNLGTPDIITQISYAPRSGWASRMVGGMFQASNDPTFSAGVVTLYTLTSTPAIGSLTTVSISNTSAFQYVRYIGPANGYCNISEAHFVGRPPSVPTPFAGTPIGTAGSYKSQGNTISNVFDGNLSTFFDAPSASGNWVGLDLGSGKVATEVEFAPRVGWDGRMVGGEIQASNSATFASGVVTLYTIGSTPASGVLTAATFINNTAYRYYRYLGPTDSYCDIAELEFLG